MKFKEKNIITFAFMTFYGILLLYCVGRTVNLQNKMQIPCFSSFFHSFLLLTAAAAKFSFAHIFVVVDIYEFKQIGGM